jgi:hypothetical protein
MTAHLPGTGTDTSIKCGGFNLLLWAPPFLSHVMRSCKCFLQKTSEIKHVNLVVDILVYHELKNVVQNLF